MTRRASGACFLMRLGCWKCGAGIEVEAAGRVAARDTCPRCDADLHTCRNCRFYDPSKSNQCAESQAEWVRDKEVANYCDYFQPNPVLPPYGLPGSPGGESAKKKFESLFKFKT